jgi:Fic family protein
MMMRKTGYYEPLGSAKHFIPYPLPPAEPPFNFSTELADLYGDTMSHLAKLNEMTNRLPDINRFIKAYVIKEALLSSSIEGINTTLMDVFTQPLTESKPNKATQLVMNYTKALAVARYMIKEEGLPISSRVIVAAHEALMSVARGKMADAGNYRKQSVRVGNLVPPTAPHIAKLLADLEQFINTDASLPPLIKAGLAHVQFETIHPFLDGNGRIGRLLIVLSFMQDGLLTEPILYPSYYFKKHHMEYYQRLDRVRTDGDFEGWITYYLKAMRESSIDAYRRAKDIEQLQEQLTDAIAGNKKLSKTQQSRMHALSVIFMYPFISIKELQKQLDVSYNTAHQIIIDFMDMGLLQESTGQKRGKLYKFTAYWEILEREY